jgi:hypothetical protein
MVGSSERAGIFGQPGAPLGQVVANLTEARQRCPQNVSVLNVRVANDPAHRSAQVVMLGLQIHMTIRWRWSGELPRRLGSQIHERRRVTGRNAFGVTARYQCFVCVLPDCFQRLVADSARGWFHVVAAAASLLVVRLFPTSLMSNGLSGAGAARRPVGRHRVALAVCHRRIPVLCNPRRGRRPGLGL